MHIDTEQSTLFPSCNTGGGGGGGGAGHLVLEWDACAAGNLTERVLFRSVLSYSDHPIKASKSANNVKRGILFTKILNKMMPERVFFIVCH